MSCSRSRTSAWKPWVSGCASVDSASESSGVQKSAANGEHGGALVESRRGGIRPGEARCGDGRQRAAEATARWSARSQAQVRRIRPTAAETFHAGCDRALHAAVRAPGDAACRPSSCSSDQV